MQKKNLLRILAIGSLAVVMLISGISAYFTDTDVKSNEFAIGQVKITLDEPNWVAENALNTLSGEPIAKDPVVINDGETQAFVFLTVDVPVATVQKVNADGTKNGDPAAAELFTYTLNSGWTQIDTETAATATDGKVTHLYVYGSDSACSALASGATTPSLFDSIQMINIAENPDVMGLDYKVDVNAYAIQSDNLGDGTETEPGAVWIMIENQMEL